MLRTLFGLVAALSFCIVMAAAGPIAFLPRPLDDQGNQHRRPLQLIPSTDPSALINNRHH